MSNAARKFFQEPLEPSANSSTGDSSVTHQNYASLSLSPSFADDISRLVQLVANTLEAHSAFLLLPVGVMKDLGLIQLELPEQAGSSEKSTALLPLSTHTLTPGAIPARQGLILTGPLSWVSRTGKPLQVSPFERSPEVLGVYSLERETLAIKSFAAVPIEIASHSHSAVMGVLAVDSLKAYRFSTLQLKLLGELGVQIERTFALHIKASDVQAPAGKISPVDAAPELPQKRSIQKAASKERREQSVLIQQITQMLSLPKKQASQENHPSLSQLSCTKISCTCRLESSDAKALFPTPHLLTAEARIERAWRYTMEDYRENSSREDPLFQNSKGLYIISDHLRSRSLGLKAKALFQHHLKKLLQFIMQDPRESAFDALVEKLIHITITPLSKIEADGDILLEWLSATISNITVQREKKNPLPVKEIHMQRRKVFIEM